MIRFGVIGTNWITERMLNAVQGLEHFQLTSVYSRTAEKAKSFAEKHHAKYTYTDLEAFAASPHIDAVYIASPNAFHREQAELCMKHGKHVLCEKPLAANSHETRSMIETAYSQEVVLLEAMKSIWMPGFHTVQEQLHRVGKVRRYHASFCQYSSRYDAYREGTVLNAFRPELANGSLMDLGVYCIYPAVVLFGKPESMYANATMLESGVDGSGSLILRYPDMEATISFSKITSSSAATEIQGEDGTIVIPKISEPGNIVFRAHDGQEEMLSGPTQHASMRYEVEAFLHMIQEEDLETSMATLTYSQAAMELMDEARRQIGLVFPNDLNK